MLKAYQPSTGEKGVLLVKYAASIQRLAATFDIATLGTHYTIVLEPSSWGYRDAVFYLFAGHDLDVVVQAPTRADYECVESMRCNLVPIRLGSGDWVDPVVFSPHEKSPRRYDVAMVASWRPLKRHVDLFKAMNRIRREHGLVLKAALVGYPHQWTREKILRLIHRYGVQDQCTVFDRVPHREVARILSESKVSVLLSRREGPNKALYESLFCDTPVIMRRDFRGSDGARFGSHAVLLIDETDLSEAILRALRRSQVMAPRAWALANSGCKNSTAKLNDCLRSLSWMKGLPWERDIVAKKNAPNLRYVDDREDEPFEADYRRLATHLLPGL